MDCFNLRLIFTILPSDNCFRIDCAVRDVLARCVPGALALRVVQHVVRVLAAEQMDALVRRGATVREPKAAAGTDARAFLQAARSEAAARSVRLAAGNVRLAALSALFVPVAGAVLAQVFVLFFRAAPVAAFVP